MRTVAYTRFSTSRVGEVSPPDAILVRTKAIEEYAASKNLEIIKRYSDRKHEPDADTAFNQMKVDGMHRKFDFVIADSVFHFGRSYTYAEELLFKTFYPAGIGFAVVEDNFSSIDHSEEEIRQYFYDKYWTNFQEKSHDALTVRLSQKELYRQTIRYGYKFSDDYMNLVIDEEAAPIIKEIFERYINHESLWGIANELERRGVTAPPDRKAQLLGREQNARDPASWNSAAIKRIIMNQIYTGYGYRRYFKQLIPMEVPPIITKEQFEMTNDIREKNGTRDCGWRTSAANIFSKMVYDKDNGCELMTSNWKYGDNRKYYIYKKQFRYITKEYVEKKQMLSYDAVIAFIREQVLIERAVANYVVKKLDENDYQNEMDEILLEEKLKAKQLFDLMTGTVSEYFKAVNECDIKRQDECTEKMEALNREYNEISKITGELKKAFGKNNPWIRKYRSAEVPEIPDRKFSRKYVDRIWVSNFSDIEFVPTEKKWRDLIPEKWITEGREEYINGKEKQKD